MFTLNLLETDTCNTCQEVTTDIADDLKVLPMPINASGIDSLQAAIYRRLHFTRVKLCTTCLKNQVHNTVSKIDAGPQVLLIQLTLFHDSFENGVRNSSKLNTKVNFPKMLDLTKHQTNTGAPLRYKLQAVTSHQGSTVDSGHYMGQMRAPAGISKTNDDIVMRSTVAALHETPQVWTEEELKVEFTPYILTYLME
jgi:ubiquitin C-terminal hydrolase